MKTKRQKQKPKPTDHFVDVNKMVELSKPTDHYSQLGDMIEPNNDNPKTIYEYAKEYAKNNNLKVVQTERGFQIL